MSSSRRTKKLVNTSSHTGTSLRFIPVSVLSHIGTDTHTTPISHVHCLLLTQACKQQTDRTTLELTCQYVASTASKVYCVTASHGLVPSHHFTRHCGWHSLRLGLVSYYRSIFFVALVENILTSRQQSIHLMLCQILQKEIIVCGCHSAFIAHG